MDRFMIKNLFGVEGLNITWYGVIICVGMFLGIWLAVYRAKKMGMKSDIIFDFAIIALPLAIIGARAYFVAFKWSDYADNIKSIFAINEGGLAIYGGVIGGLLAALIFIAWRKVSFLVLADLAIPSLVLGQAIGRWGNFINQEAYGNLITDPKLQFFPYGVYIDNIKEWHQATFFYESMLCLVIFAVLMILSYKKAKTGTLLSIYLFVYGLGRFVIEGMRTDSLLLSGNENFRISQMLSAVLVATGFVLYVFVQRGIIKSKNKFGVYAVNNSGEDLFAENVTDKAETAETIDGNEQEAEATEINKEVSDEIKEEVAEEISKEIEEENISKEVSEEVQKEISEETEKVSESSQTSEEIENISESSQTSEEDKKEN